MENIKDYIFVALWFIIAVYLLVQGKKENKIFYLYSLFFLFMTIWYLIDAITPDLDLFSGVYAWIFRCIVAVILIITIVFLVLNRRKDNNDK